jgi:hypothetical protein
VPLTSVDAVPGAIPGCRRPLCVRGHRVPGAVRATDGGGTTHGQGRDWHGRGPKGPRTGPVGAVTPTVRRSGVSTVLPGVWLLTCHFRTPARCRRRPRHRVLPGVLGTEGVGDALVGGGVAVDAVSVDLRHNGDAVPGPASDLGRGPPEFSPTATPPRAAGHTGGAQAAADTTPKEYLHSNPR